VREITYTNKPWGFTITPSIAAERIAEEF